MTWLRDTIRYQWYDGKGGGGLTQDIQLITDDKANHWAKIALITITYA